MYNLMIVEALKFIPSAKTAIVALTGATLFAFAYFVVYNHGYNSGFNKASVILSKDILDLKNEKNKQLQETIKELARQQQINLELSKQKQQQQIEYEKQKQDLIEDINRIKGKQENEVWLNTPVPVDVLEFLHNKNN